MEHLYIGLMSGTSVDAIDAVLVDLSGQKPNVVTSYAHPIEDQLRRQLLDLALQQGGDLEQLGRVDVAMGRAFAEAVQQLLQRSSMAPSQVTAIGCHGQTVRHRPDADPPFTLQIGDPNTIAQLSGITTVADFRRRDMAAGGCGAPLAPAFHAALFGTTAKRRVVLNIGGMANITILPVTGGEPVTGFDTGPGNALLDSWAERHLGQPYDHNGAWAGSGQIDATLLQRLLTEPYFALPPPKSTGRELFNMAWLESHLDGKCAAADIQTTLAELTATTIADALTCFAADSAEVVICGGGSHNGYLLERLQQLLGIALLDPGAFGVAADWIEAVAFAWLAQRTLRGETGNIPSVTGATSKVVLGAIYPA